MISPDRQMVVAVTAGLNDMGKEMDLLNDYLFPAADMPPASSEMQQKLQNRLAELEYLWPEHEDDVSVLAHAYQGEGIRLTVAAHGVQLDMESEPPIHAAFGWCEPETFVVEETFAAAPPIHWQGAAGWKDGKLTLSARTVEGPFMIRAEAVQQEDGLAFALDGVGVEPRRVLLKKE